MFTRYTKAELIRLFPLQFVSLQPDFTITKERYILPDLGECDVFHLPIRFLSDNRTDTIVGFVPQDHYWQTEPVCYAFLFEMQQAR